jgi:hypothetical protein
MVQVGSQKKKKKADRPPTMGPPSPSHHHAQKTQIEDFTLNYKQTLKNQNISK